MQKKQPLVAPSDVKRYFVSPQESGQICMLACILGNGGEVFFPKLGEDQMLTFSAICDDFVKVQGFGKDECTTDAEAKAKAQAMSYEPTAKVNSQSIPSYISRVTLLARKPTKSSIFRARR